MGRPMNHPEYVRQPWTAERRRAASVQARQRVRQANAPAIGDPEDAALAASLDHLRRLRNTLADELAAVRTAYRVLREHREARRKSLLSPSPPKL